MLVDVRRNRGLIERDLCPVLLLQKHLLYHWCRVTAPCSSWGAGCCQAAFRGPGASTGREPRVGGYLVSASALAP